MCAYMCRYMNKQKKQLSCENVEKIDKSQYHHNQKTNVEKNVIF